MRAVRHWWNGSWGRLSRRDVYVRTDGKRWEVEARLGGAEGRSTVWTHDDEAGALERARSWLDPRFTWTELD
jgi:hypothetical protein